MIERDRNLLFGIFAVQLKKLTPSQLVDAAAAWAADPSRDLAQRLRDTEALSETDVKFLSDLVDHAVRAHGNDAAATLSSIGGDEQIQQSFAGSIVATPTGGLRTVITSPVSLSNSTDDVPGVDESPGRYLSVSEYARGGMGRVLLVHDEHLNRDIALKELLPDLHGSTTNADSPARKSTPFIARFLQEARITGQLEHPSIVPVYELGKRGDGALYYTMKLVRGKTLAAAIKDAGNLNGRLKLLPHFVNLCNAIAYAHSRGVIHRDLKPANVMVGEFGETVVLDWGLAKANGKTDVHADGLAESIRAMNVGSAADFAKTTYGQAMGTPAYMPPEQAKGELEKIDERSDIYALGAILYEILTGRPPFTGSSVHELIYKAINEEPKPVRATERRVPADILKLCEKALAKGPANRFASAKALADAVQACKLRRPKGRLRKTIERGSLAAVVMFILFTSFMNMWTGEVLDREIEALGLTNTTLADWIATHGETNVTVQNMPGTLKTNTGATAIWHLEKLNPNFRDYVGETDRNLVDGDKTELSFTRFQKIDSDIRRIAAQYGPVDGLFREIAAMPHATANEVVDVGGIRGKTFSAIEFPDVAWFGRNTNIVLASAYVAFQDGETAKSIETCTTILDVAGHLRDQRMLLPELVAQAMTNKVLMYLEGLPADTPLQEKSIRDLDDRLVLLRPRESTRASMECERAIGLVVLQTLRHTSLIDVMSDKQQEYSMALKLYSSWPFRWWFNLDTLMYVRICNAQIYLFNCPLSQRHDAEIAVNDRLLVADTHRLRYLWTEIFAQRLTDLLGKVLYTEARVSECRLHLALLRYHATNGNLPTSLDMLVPTYVSALPPDPFSDGPFHYELNGDAYTITAVGRDGILDTAPGGDDVVWSRGTLAPVWPAAK